MFFERSRLLKRRLLSARTVALYGGGYFYSSPSNGSVVDSVSI